MSTLFRYIKSGGLYEKSIDIRGPLYRGLMDELDGFTAPEKILREVVIGKNVKSIASRTFKEFKELYSVTIPGSVETIGSDAFLLCTGLRSVTISNGLTSIGDSAFHFCYELRSVTIPDSVKSIGNNAFKECINLQSAPLPTNDNFTTIGVSVFEECRALKSVTIPENVTTIGNKAFFKCFKLQNVTIPNSVKSIGESAFQKCKELYNIENDNYVNTIGNGVTTIGKNVFAGCKKLQYLTIPDSVTSIGNGAFTNSGLSSMSIPDSVQTIDNSAFAYCNKLQFLIIGDSVTSIGEVAFRGCSALKSVTIPDSVTSIGDSAFMDCKKLQSLTIGNSVTSIGNDAFQSCSALQSVILGGNVTSIGTNAFLNTGLSVVQMLYSELSKLNSKYFSNNLPLIPNTIQYDFFGAKNVYIAMINTFTFIQPGIISGDENGFDAIELGIDAIDLGKIVLRYYKPTQRTFEQSRDGFFIADLTKIAAIENVSITEIKWFKKNTDDDNYTEQTNYYNKRTYPYSSDVIVKVQCTYSIDGNETTVMSNPNETDQTKIDTIVDDFFEFERLDNLPRIFTNAEFRKTLTKLYNTSTTIDDDGFLDENGSYLYENMQEVELKVIIFDGNPFPYTTRYYIRGINKYLKPKRFPWINNIDNIDKNFYFYLKKTGMELAKTRENDGVDPAIIDKDLSVVFADWNTKNIKFFVKTNCYKKNEYYSPITSASNLYVTFAYNSTFTGPSVFRAESKVESPVTPVEPTPVDPVVPVEPVVPVSPVVKSDSDVELTTGGTLIFPNGITSSPFFMEDLIGEKINGEGELKQWTFGKFKRDFKCTLDLDIIYDEIFDSNQQIVKTKFELRGEHWQFPNSNFAAKDVPYRSAGGEGGGSCFPGNSKLILKDGTKKIFHDIQYGDEIQVCSKDMKLSYSKIVLMPHLRNNESREFIKLTTTSNQTIRATNNHYLPVLNKKDKLQNIMAYEITKGDKLYVLINGKGIPEEIKSIEIIKEKGIYSCLVKEGEYIVVDNIVASPFYGYRDDFGYISKYIYSYNITSIYAKGFAMLDNLGLMYIVAPLYRCTESLVTNLLKIFRK